MLVSIRLSNPVLLRARLPTSYLLYLARSAPMALDSHAPRQKPRRFRYHDSKRRRALRRWAADSAALETDDTGSFFANPALLGQASHNQLSFTYLNHVAGINSGTVRLRAWNRFPDDRSQVGCAISPSGRWSAAMKRENRRGRLAPPDIDLSAAISRRIGSGVRYRVIGPPAA